VARLGGLHELLTGPVDTSRRSLGALAWARQSGGRLSRSHQLTLLMEAALLRLNARLRRQQQPPFCVDLGSIRVPDSGLCKSASELLISVSEPWLVNHCLRTFLWAAILGMKGQHRFDEELLFVASALHDLGLTGAGARLSPSQAECFAVEGAFAAERFLAEHGVDHRRQELVAEAISLHLNVKVPLSHGIEAHLLHEGAALDVVGGRFDEVAATTRHEVLGVHPRLGMKSGLVAAFEQQSSMRPRSRAGFLCRLGFISMIRHAPFEDHA
jgi:hypothetical protein